MTYEFRVKHRELAERSADLRERLAEGHAGGTVTRGEARELAALLDEVIALLSPGRWDRMMETVVDEASRRAGALSPTR